MSLRRECEPCAAGGIVSDGCGVQLETERVEPAAPDGGCVWSTREHTPLPLALCWTVPGWKLRCTCMCACRAARRQRFSIKRYAKGRSGWLLRVRGCSCRAVGVVRLTL